MEQPITDPGELPAFWDSLAADVDALGDLGEGGQVANRRVAATLRFCADAYREARARQEA